MAEGWRAGWARDKLENTHGFKRAARRPVWELLSNNADLDATEVELHVEAGEVTLTLKVAR